MFTSTEDAPAPGDWMGLWFGYIPSEKNKLNHVIIEYAGADCGCSLASCSNITESEGAVMLSNRPASRSSRTPRFVTSPVMASSRLAKRGRHGDRLQADEHVRGRERLRADETPQHSGLRNTEA